MWRLMPWSEYKRIALEEAAQYGWKQTAKRLGIGKTTIHRWKNEAEKEKQQHE